MFSKDHINQIDRIINEIDNYHYSHLLNDEGMGILQRFYDNNILLKIWYWGNCRSIAVFHNDKIIIELYNKIAMSSLSSIINNEIFYSNGRDPIRYNCIKLSEFTKDEYFNMMVSNDEIIGYNCIELGSDVDELFFKHQMHGRINSNLKTDLSSITLK